MIEDIIKRAKQGDAEYEQVKKLHSVLDSLTEEEKDIITRFYIKGEKIKDIAEDYKLSYSEAYNGKRSILFKIKKKLAT